jgi:molecular chaperone DnaK (HSP70)
LYGKRRRFDEKSHKKRTYNKIKYSKMGKIIGIDLGTTNLCVSVMEGEAYS